MEQVLSNAVWVGQLSTRTFRFPRTTKRMCESFHESESRDEEISSGLWELVDRAPPELFQNNLELLKDPAQAGAATLVATRLDGLGHTPAEDLYYWLVLAPPDPRSDQIWPTVAKRYHLDPRFVPGRDELLAAIDSCMFGVDDSEDDETTLNSNEKQHEVELLVKQFIPEKHFTIIKDHPLMLRVQLLVDRYAHEWDDLKTGWQLTEAVEERFTVHHVDHLIRHVRDIPAWSPLNSKQRRQLLVDWLAGEPPNLVADSNDIFPLFQSPNAVYSSDTLSDVDCH